MAESIELSLNSLRATVNSHGGWLTRYTVDGEPLFFPKASLPAPAGGTKLRGGSHVCLPNFGPGGDSGLPQHGFARESDWSVGQKTDASVELSLQHTTGDYAGLKAVLSYALQASGISMRLNVENGGTKSLRLSPGFHPYFASSDVAVMIDNFEYNRTDLNEAEVLSGAVTSRTLKADGRTYHLESEGLPNWIAWTDKLGDYVCLEPTYGAMGFADGANEDQAFNLEPGTTWSCAITITHEQ